MSAASRPLSRARIVVFDTETTGLSPVKDHVVEIAALAIENGVETGRFESLVDPGVPIPPALTAIHGISDEMVRGRPRFPEVARRFLDFTGDSILAAHNASYDVAMMLVPARAAGLAPAGNRVLDTCRLARRLIESPRYQLGTLARTLGIEMPTAHRAMADVVACAGVLRACLAKMGEGATLEEVERAAGLRLEFGTGLALAVDLPPGLLPLAEAVGNGRSVRIAYRGGSHGDGPRDVTPVLFLLMDGALNVSAHCHIERSLKNFRADRIAEVRPL